MIRFSPRQRVFFHLVFFSFTADANECEINNGGCEHDCQNTLGSFFCSCRDGYLRDFVHPSKCMDIDECAMGVTACFDCHNTPGR